MVEAAILLRLHPTSILDVYKVFEHLEMLWMGIWVCTYAVLYVQVGVDFGKNGVWPSLYDVVRSWFFPVGEKLIAPGMQSIEYVVIHKTRRSKRELHN